MRLVSYSHSWYFTNNHMLRRGCSAKGPAQVLIEMFAHQACFGVMPDVTSHAGVTPANMVCWGYKPCPPRWCNPRLVNLYSVDPRQIVIIVTNSCLTQVLEMKCSLLSLGGWCTDNLPTMWRDEEATCVLPDITFELQTCEQHGKHAWMCGGFVGRCLKLERWLQTEIETRASDISQIIADLQPVKQCNNLVVIFRLEKGRIWRPLIVVYWGHCPFLSKQADGLTETLCGARSLQGG